MVYDDASQCSLLQNIKRRYLFWLLIHIRYFSYDVAVIQWITSFILFIAVNSMHI